MFGRTNMKKKISGKILKEKEPWMVEGRPYQTVKHVIKPQK